MSLPTRERGLKYGSQRSGRRQAESLPTRERGLKFLFLRRDVVPGRSLPTRERGLKLGYFSPALEAPASLPTRERGLKLSHASGNGQYLPVAPCAGAWIEILDNLSSDVLPDGSLPTRERLPTPRFNNLSEPFAK